MAVVLKDIDREAKEKHLTIIPHPKVGERVEYEFPYDDMYLLYDYIFEEMKQIKRG